MKPYAVVTFVNDISIGLESSSEIPSCWLCENLTQCWWPNTKNVSPLILKRTLPDKTNDQKWRLYDVQCVGFYGDLSSARQKADGLSSCDEAADVPEERKRQTFSNYLSPIKKTSEVRNLQKKRKIQKERNKQDDYLAADESAELDGGNRSIPSPPELHEKNAPSLQSNNAFHQHQPMETSSTTINNSKPNRPTVTQNIPVSRDLISRDAAAS